MFAFFLAGTALAFALVFLSPIAIFSRWWSLPMSFISAITFVLILAASTIASVISFIFKYAATAQSTLNIHASVGVRMLIFMWIATGCALVGFVLHAGMGCCCTSRRDLKRGVKPMRHSSMHRAMSQRSQSQRSLSQRSMAQNNNARSATMVAGGAAAHNRSHSAFSFEQPPASQGRSRSGTLLSTNDLEKIQEHSGAGASRSNSRNGSSASRSNTLKGDVSRSNTVKSGLAGGGRARSNTQRSIRWDDERPPSYESDATVVNSPDGLKEPPASRQRHSTVTEE